MRTPFTPAQATALAKFLLTVRPDWTLSYAEDAVGRMRLIDDDLEHIVRAAIRGALSPNIRKPDVLAMGGDHWKARIDEEPERPAAIVRKRCDTCGGLHAWNAPHDPPEVARVPDVSQRVAHLRAEIRPCKAPDKVAEKARATTDTELPEETP
jgi:hypothetical protein